MTAANPSGWRPEMGDGGAAAIVTASGAATGIVTASGDRGLMLEEPLSFELGRAGTCGVDLDEPERDILPGLAKFRRQADQVAARLVAAIDGLQG